MEVNASSAVSVTSKIRTALAGKQDGRTPEDISTTALLLEEVAAIETESLTAEQTEEVFV